MVLFASCFEKMGGFHLIIAQDKEEADLVQTAAMKNTPAHDCTLFFCFVA